MRISTYFKGRSAQFKNTIAAGIVAFALICGGSVSAQVSGGFKQGGGGKTISPIGNKIQRPPQKTLAEPTTTLLNDSMLNTIAKEMNASCPVKMGETVEMISVTASPGKRFEYAYKLAAEKKTLDIAAAKSKTEESLIPMVKTNEALKIFRDSKVTMVYIYYDQNKELMFKVTITPDMYE